MSADIRRAVIGDEMVLASLNGPVQQVHLAHRPDHFRSTQPAELTMWYRSLLERSTTRIWIAEHNGVPVGYVLAILHQLPENPFARARRWCEIDQVAVDPEWRRQGIARALIQHAIYEAKSEGIAVEANSWSFSTGAHELFRSLGFAPKTTRFELKAGE